MIIPNTPTRRTTAAFLLLAALATAGEKKQVKKPGAAVEAAPPPPPESLIWPLPPDPPRVKWVAEYRDMAKIKSPNKKGGWLDKVTGTKTLEERLELRKPYGIATDSRGRIYTADTELKIVFMIDPVNKIVERRESSTRAPMNLPAGVAVDAQDRLFVSDAALHTILCFEANGQPVGHFGTSTLGRPGGIAIDKVRNRLYVADAKESRIAVFDSKSLEFVGLIGAPSTPGRRELGKFYAPTNVAVDRNGLIYVADTWNNRVQVLNTNGEVLRAFGAQGDRPGEFIRPKGIAVDSEGHIYVADAEFNNFQILSPEGKPLLAIGTLGIGPGQFALIGGIHIDSKDRIYTSEMFRGRLQVFQYISQPSTADSSPLDGKEVRAKINR